MKIFKAYLFSILLLLLSFSGSYAHEECEAGGIGAESCSITVSSWWGFFEDTWSTSCAPGTYACCNEGSATCEFYPQPQDPYIAPGF